MITECLKSFKKARPIVTRGEFSAFVSPNNLPIGVFENEMGEEFTFLIGSSGFFSEGYVFKLINFVQTKTKIVNLRRTYVRSIYHYEFNFDPKYRFSFSVEKMKGGSKIVKQKIILQNIKEEPNINCFRFSKCLTVEDMIHINEGLAKYNNARKTNSEFL